MDLLQNPFYILNVTTRDNRRRITELSEERSLHFDADKCIQARSDLTNPRKRISVEIAWLPGIGPKRIAELLSLLETSVLDVIFVNNLIPVASANLIAAGLIRLPSYTASEVIDWIIELANEFENIIPETLCEVINEERIVSGFPAITDLSVVEAEIQERRRYYRDVIKLALDNLPTNYLVEAVTTIANKATNCGEDQAPQLIDDMINAYEVEAQDFLSKEEENIKTLVENIKHASDTEYPDSSVLPMITQLIQVVKNWGTVAKPIQVSRSSQGLDHDESYSVAYCVRDLAILLFNEHDKLEFSQQLTNMLQMEFEGVADISDRITGDANTLGEIAENRIQQNSIAKNNAEERRREITYSANLGLVFKDKLSISPEGIEWDNRVWNLDTITWICWGGTRKSVNGIPTGTTYTIRFGTDSEQCHITLSKLEIYNNFTDRLWKAVGVRLLIEHLVGLREGKKYKFGSALMSDIGMELEQYNIFSKNERIFCRWSELVIWDGPGVFCVGKKGNQKFSVTLSYQDEKNTHVLEAMLRAFWKRGGERMSSLLVEG